MEVPVETPVPGALPAGRGRSVIGEWTIALTIACVLTLAAGALSVFYASIQPISIPEGYGAVLLDFPWILAFLALAAMWLGAPVILLVLGLVHLLRHAVHRWRSAGGWLILLAANVATGFLVMHFFRLLFLAYPKDSDGEPLGPSRWAPGGPYWPALGAAAAELAVGAVMIALVSASSSGGFPAWRRLRGRLLRRP